MEGQQYLNQISAANRPVKNTGGKGRGILSSKFFIVGMVGLVGLIIIIIIGAILGGGKGSGGKELGYALKFHLNNTSDVIKEYQSDVKSSNLRSSSSSLYGVLTDTSKKLDEYLAAKYKTKDKDISKSIQTEAEKSKEALEKELFEAKINGNLDRIYAHKMAYEIALLTTEEKKIFETTGDESLKGLLGTSYESLTNLYAKFNEFSETNN